MESSVPQLQIQVVFVRTSTQEDFLGGPVVKTPCFYLIQQLDQFFLGELESYLPGNQGGGKNPKGFWTHISSP